MGQEQNLLVLHLAQVSRLGYTQSLPVLHHILLPTVYYNLNTHSVPQHQSENISSILDN